MRSFRPKTIRTKLVTAVGIAVVCGVLLASLASAWRETNYYFESKQAEMTGIAAAIAVPIAPKLAARDRRGVAIAINAIGRVKSINYARVLSKEGNLVYELGSGILISREVNSKVVPSSFGPLDAVYFGALPFRTDIIHHGQKIGSLELIADLSEMRNILWISLAQALIFGVIAALFGMVTSNYYQRRIAEPIVALTSVMKHVQSEHDFDRRADRMSDDETGQLVDAFNAMLDEIGQRDRALADHRDNLEATVVERTADLVVAKEEADRANAAKSQFLATMSHEIRTPMNGMLATAELLTSAQLPAKQQRHAEIIMRSGKSLLAIINDILDLSKVESGKLELECLPVEPAMLADDVTQLFWERAQGKGLELCAYVAPDVPETIMGDPIRLNQILANLINNALKFTEAGHVLIKMSMKPADKVGSRLRNLEIAVEDTGIGISEDKLSGIFDAFVQADASVTRSHCGTGIGLSICKKLVDAMDGQLTATSVEGQGSTFTLTLPVDVEQSTEPQSVGAREGANQVALVLKPSPTRDILRSYLEDAGFVVTALAEASESLIAENPYCLIAGTEEWQSIQNDKVLWQPEVSIVLSAGSLARQTSSKEQSLYDAEISQPLSLAELRPLVQAIAKGPDAVQHLSGEVAKSVSEDSPRFVGIRALAADDNEVNREILTEALARLGIKTDCVEDGRGAVEAYQAQSYDIVFMDVSMPILDGYGATAQIRKHEIEQGQSRTPIIALTAHAYGSEANQWQESDMDACVTKPFTLGSLQQALSALLPDHKSNATAHDETTAEDPKIIDGVGDPPHVEGRLLIDDSVLDGIEEMQREGDALVDRIIDLYRQHAPKALQHLLELNDDADGDVVASSAHALKSLSRNVGALAVGDICDQIEIDARAGRAALDAAILLELQNALDATLEAFTQRMTPQSANELRTAT